jgi:transposase
VFPLSLDILFPHLHDFRLLSYSRETTRLVLTCERMTLSAPCPVCGAAAHRIHSRYERTVWDLSVQNVQVLLHLHVRKFYCDQPDCPRRIFTERLPGVTLPHGRFTFGLREFLGQLEQGGASGARSATLQGLQVTARAILRFMQALPLPPIAAPQIIGLDEWAWKRGQRYGAIVVDLERNKPIALLADRSQEAVAGWLKRYPMIQIVARDRSKEFAAAITAALPQAKHVADRWHVAKNLTEHLDKVVSRCWNQLTKAVGEAEMPSQPVPIAPAAHRSRQASGEIRYQQMLALKEAGLPTGTIAKRLGVGPRTIQRWLAEGHGPYAGPRKPRRSPLDWSTRYLRQRWKAGECNGTVLWQELKAKGYCGSSRSVYRRLAKWREHPQKYGLPASLESVPRSPLEDVTPGRVIGWMLARPGELRPQAQAQLDQITQMDGTLAQARELTQGFLNLIRHHSGEGLDTWRKRVRASTVREFLTFARSVERDKAAIVAGLTLPYSTGPVEGHINRLKLIKRQAYGRAELSYLQHRFLPAASSMGSAKVCTGEPGSARGRW